MGGSMALKYLKYIPVFDNRMEGKCIETILGSQSLAFLKVDICGSLVFCNTGFGLIDGICVKLNFIDIDYINRQLEFVPFVVWVYVWFWYWWPAIFDTNTSTLGGDETTCMSVKYVCVNQIENCNNAMEKPVLH